MPETKQKGLNEDVLAAMGGGFKTGYLQAADAFKARTVDDPRNINVSNITA